MAQIAYQSKAVSRVSRGIGQSLSGWKRGLANSKANSAQEWTIRPQMSKSSHLLMDCSIALMQFFLRNVILWNIDGATSQITF